MILKKAIFVRPLFSSLVLIKYFVNGGSFFIFFDNIFLKKIVLYFVSGLPYRNDCCTEIQMRFYDNERWEWSLKQNEKHTIMEKSLESTSTWQRLGKKATRSYDVDYTAEYLQNLPIVVFTVCTPPGVFDVTQFSSELCCYYHNVFRMLCSPA